MFIMEFGNVSYLPIRWTHYLTIDGILAVIIDEAAY